METNCIFCKIANGDIPAIGKFWENDTHMAFLTPWPNTEGFTVVIPKKHLTSDCLELENDDLSELTLYSKEVSKILKKHFKDVGRVGLMMEGTGVDHAHAKLFPMHGTTNTAPKEIYFEKYEGYISSQEGPKVDDEVIKKLAQELKDIQ